MASLAQRAANKLRRIGRQRVRGFASPMPVAIIGCGQIAPAHLDGYDESVRARVVAVSDVQPSALGRVLDRYPGVRGFRDYHEMLEQARPQIVSICTWPQSHAELVRSCAEWGVKAILCEKPLALTLDDLRQMEEVCRQHQVKLAGGHQYRFQPTFVEARQAIRSGELGRVERIEGHISGSLANNGPHLFDTVRFLLGDVPARRIECRCTRTKGKFDRAWPAEDESRGEVFFDGDVRFTFLTGDAAPSFFAIRVIGDRGELEATPKSLVRRGSKSALSPDAAKSQMRREQFVEFVRWVRGETPNYAAQGEQAARTAELVLAAYAAAASSGSVALPLTESGDIIRRLYPDVPPQHVCENGSARLPKSRSLALDGGPRALPKWFSNKPRIGLAEWAGVSRVLATGHLNGVGGSQVPALEREFAAAYGRREAVASSSGTAALHLAVAAVNPEPGDEVVTTPMTDIGTVIPILACNCLPIFADIDPVTGNLTAETIAARLTPKTKAVIVVHLFGRPANLGPIVELCRQRNIPLIEDCSQAHWAEYEGHKVGTYGELACYSLQQSKQITCGDGGLTLTNDPGLGHRARLFVDKGWDRTGGSRSHCFLGMNYRMTELQAAVARAQLKRLPRLVADRRTMAEALCAAIRPIRGVILPDALCVKGSAWWKFNFQIDEVSLGVSTDTFAEALLVEGVKVQRDYLPRPLFDEDVLRLRRTFGQSGFPLTAFGYRSPEMSDFPGLAEFFRRQLILSWSARVRPQHVRGIADAVRKICDASPGTAR